MQARVSDPTLLPSLDAFLRRLGCVTEQIAPDRLLISIPGSLRGDAAEMMLDLYLRLWAQETAAGHAERVT